MAIRHKFGPRLVDDWSNIAPAAPAAPALPDVDVSIDVPNPPVPTATGAAGTVDMDVVFTFPSFNPATSNPIAQVYALLYLDGAPLPSKPADALASGMPMGTGVPPAALQAGGNMSVTIAGIPIGHGTILTVLDYNDPEPPTDPPAPAAPSTPAGVPAS